MFNQKKYVCLLSVVFILLSACVRNDNLSAEKEQKKLMEIADEDLPKDRNQGESTKITDNVFVDVDYETKKNGFIELIKKVNYRGSPEQFTFPILWESEYFLELEERSDELLNYAIDIFQDGTLTYEDHVVLRCALQSVEFEKYKYFLRDLSLCVVDGGKINELTFENYFSSQPHYVLVPENYQDPVIRETFEILLRSDRIRSGFRAVIIDHLNR